MAGQLEKKFIKLTEQMAFDRPHREVMEHNIGQYQQAFEASLDRFQNLENAKRKAHIIKWRVMENLDRYLHEFETRFLQRGGKVIWANTAEEALEEIGKIIQSKQAKSIVKSKSMVTEEIGLNEFLEKKGLAVWESDLGELIVQKLDQKPYHLVTPAMHLSRKEIAELFHNHWGTALEATAEELTAKAREVVRSQFRDADIGITGANFLIAENGTVAITENEGNARLSTAFPKTHIVVAGIEKIIPQTRDLGLFWPLLASHGTGQALTTYSTILGGPRQGNEKDGPEEMFVILLDNGRTDLLAQPEQRQGLYCIRCGACLNVCPVYQNIGGHAYQNTYSGPIGSLINPHTTGMKEFVHLSHASTLCGKCTEVCPVKIPIDRMLTLNRRDAVQKGIASPREKWNWKIFTWFSLKRKRMDQFGPGLKNFLLKVGFGTVWGPKRKRPVFKKKSFSEQYRENNKPKA